MPFSLIHTKDKKKKLIKKWEFTHMFYNSITSHLDKPADKQIKPYNKGTLMQTGEQSLHWKKLTGNTWYTMSEWILILSLNISNDCRDILPQIPHKQKLSEIYSLIIHTSRGLCKQKFSSKKLKESWWNFITKLNHKTAVVYLLLTAQFCLVPKKPC